MTTKILALTDALGNLVRFVLLPGQRFDTVGVPPLIEGLTFEALIADKAFDSNAIIAELDARGAKVVISQHPRRAKPLAIDEERGVLRIGFPESATFNKKKAESSTNVERMTDALASIAGERLRPVYELIDGPGEEAAPEKAAEMSEDELVDLVKDSFDASEVVSDDARESGAG